MTTPATIDHATEALDRLTDAFKGRAVIEGMLKSFTMSLQLVEASTQDLFVKRILDNATDDALDK